MKAVIVLVIFTQACIFGSRSRNDGPDSATSPSDMEDVRSGDGDMGSNAVTTDTAPDARLPPDMRPPLPDMRSDIDMPMPADPLGDGIDQNNDGVDGVLDQNVYVMEGAPGPAIASGLLPNDPVGEIAAGVAIADATGRPNIVVGSGIYGGGFTLTIRAYTIVGGYAAGYVAVTGTSIIDRAQSAGSAAWALGVDSTPDTVHLQNIELRTTDGTNAEPVPITMFVRNANRVVLQNSNVVGAVGRSGGIGRPGSEGATGGMGARGDGVDTSNNLHPGGSGGGSACNAGGGRGGNGGVCNNGAPQPGSPGSPVALGGLGGTPGSNTCAAGSSGTNGQVGVPGQNGAGAMSVVVAIPGEGSFANGTWSPESAAAGASGESGGGGGGGGGGGAGRTSPLNDPRSGASGGGGGAGGCGGGGGGPGEPGAASFAVMLVNSRLEFVTTTVRVGTGGDGGMGGRGACGGGGVSGGVGGAGSLIPAGGGSGGAGGAGGNGGGGQGGHGGHAFGIAGVGLDIVAPDGTFVDGRPGAGGEGGIANVGCGGAAGTNGEVGPAGAPGSAFDAYAFP